MQQTRRDNRIRVMRGLDDSRVAVCRAQRQQLEWILACEQDDLWADRGHRNFPEWLGARLKISQWEARRRVKTAHALRSLPRIDTAFQRGDLSLEHVVELCRFATPDTEAGLVEWACRVKPKAVRRRAEVEERRSRAESLTIDRVRYLHYWWMDDGRLALEGAFPADQGAVIATALDRLADRTPDIREHDDGDHSPQEVSLDIRRADALYALASARLANDQDPDRATVVVRAPLAALSGHDERGCEIDNGPVIHAETARRMSCDARIEFVLHNDLGDVVGIGRTDRNPTAWIKRALKLRDKTCTFPGCESKRFLHAHHIQHWSRGGRTDLDNLTLVCTFHHKLVHEYGWDVVLGRDGLTRWFRPGGTAYEPGRAPPEQQVLAVA